VPSTSPERQARWPGMDSEAIAVLEEAGYKQTRQWTWIPPTWDHVPTEREDDAITYLVEEFDWGGLERPPTTKRCVDERIEVPLDLVINLLEGAHVRVPDRARLWVDNRRRVLVIRHKECN